MCYPKPGPRCSGHTRHRVEVTALAMSHAQHDLYAAKKQHGDSFVPHPDVEKAEQSLRSARFDAEEARQAYLQTPDGIRSLERELASERWKSDGTPSLASQEKMAALESQIARMKVHRARQLNDYRRSKGMPEVPLDEWSMSVEDDKHEEQNHPEIRQNPCPECDSGEVESVGHVEYDTGHQPYACNAGCGFSG